MRRTVQTIFILSLVSMFSLTSVAVGLAADTVRFGTGWSTPHYTLVMWAGEDHGIWKKAGLEVKWSQIRGSGRALKAVMANALDMAQIRVEPAVLGISRGARAIIVANTKVGTHFGLFVRTDGPIRKPSDLKGRTIVASSSGGADHISAQFLLKVLGLEGQVKIIFARGERAKQAVLKRGLADAESTGEIGPMGIAEIRELVSTRDYLPKDWADIVLVSSDRFRKSSPGVLRRMLKAWFEAREVARTDYDWAVKRLVAAGQYKEKIAQKIAKIQFVPENTRLNIKAMENVINYMLEYKLIKKEDLAAREALYTVEYAR